MEEINWPVIMPLIAIQLVLMIIAFVDLSKRESTLGPKWLWVLLVIFGNVLGTIAYFVIGRRNDA